MRTVNVPLLRKVVEWAEAEAEKPEIDSEWNQGLWYTPPFNKAWFLIRDATETSDTDAALVSLLAPHCGSSYCIAGYIAQSVDERYRTQNTVNGVESSTVAANELGINESQACSRYGLFYGSNTIHDIRRIAEQLAGEKL